VPQHSWRCIAHDRWGGTAATKKKRRSYGRSFLASQAVCRRFSHTPQLRLPLIGNGTANG
jgi:hypothetical protein